LFSSSNKKLKKIIFGHNFNNHLLYLPNTFKKLTLGWRFNRHIGKLSIDLEVLTLGKNLIKELLAF